jgi:hypothetical protein
MIKIDRGSNSLLVATITGATETHIIGNLHGNKSAYKPRIKANGCVCFDLLKSYDIMVGNDVRIHLEEGDTVTIE